ncbi:MAG: DUF2851 family protein, partial [Chloroflexota bacterium]
MNELEGLLTHIWEHGLAGMELVSDDGRPVRVISPGDRSRCGGPDFRDAEVLLGGEAVRGDVEVHVGCADWRRHGHDRDEAYNGLVLHVALHCDSLAPVRLRGGRQVPTVFVGRFLQDEVYARVAGRLAFQPRCRDAVEAMGEERVRVAVRLAGEERFAGKVARFREALAREEPGQVLFAGLMRALGYSHNMLQFEELARHLPLAVLQELAPAERRALLFGSAGLLPSQRLKRLCPCPDEETDCLEQTWRRWRREPVLRESAWHFCGSRPHNFPSRRIAAAGYFAGQYPERLLVGVMGLVLATLEGGSLVSRLVVSAPGYWAAHYDFALSLKTGESALVGPGKAAEMAVNVVLPFAFAWGETG